MFRFFALAAPMLGSLVFVTGSPAQAKSDAYLYVGANSNALTRGFGTATLTSSGTMASGLFAFINADPSTTNYEGLSTFSNAQLTISGGTFQYLLADDASAINILGSNFTESTDFFFSPSGDPYYAVSGTLQDSRSPFTAGFYAPSTGTLEFNGVAAVRGAPASNPVPEASTTISLGLLLMLGLGSLVVTRRVKSASSRAR